MGSAIIDIKTGNVQPFTALQLAAYSLLDAPVEFISDGHIYTDAPVDGVGRLYPSVTTILKAEGSVRDLRLALTAATADVLKSGAELLTMRVPDRM